MVTELDLGWARQGLALKRQAQDEEIARYVAWRERTERTLRAARAAREAVAKQINAPRPAPTFGANWRVLEHPRVSHEELEAHTRRVWDLAFHAVPWPTGWVVKWAELTHSDSLVLVYGECVWSAKLILIDERNQRGRTPREFLTLVLHELCHVQHPGDVHGVKFSETLKRVTSYMLDESPAMFEPRPASSMPPRNVTLADRPWLRGPFSHQGEEYRG
jgi:hypothetical protein